MLRQRRPDPRRGLGGDRRRRRQLPNALPAERRLSLAPHPRRARLDLPLRGPGHRLRSWFRPVLPLSLPTTASAGERHRAAPRAECWASPGRDRLDPGRGDAQARARDRRAPRRATPPLRRAGRLVRRGLGAPRPRLSRLRRLAHDHRVRRLRRVLCSAPAEVRAQASGTRSKEAPRTRRAVWSSCATGGRSVTNAGETPTRRRTGSGSRSSRRSGSWRTTATAAAVFHSHPRSPPKPSRADLERAGLWAARPWLILRTDTRELAAMATRRTAAQSRSNLRSAVVVGAGIFGGSLALRPRLSGWDVERSSSSTRPATCAPPRAASLD